MKIEKMIALAFALAFGSAASLPARADIVTATLNDLVYYGGLPNPLDPETRFTVDVTGTIVFETGEKTIISVDIEGLAREPNGYQFFDIFPGPDNGISLFERSPGSFELSLRQNSILTPFPELDCADDHTNLCFFLSFDPPALSVPSFLHIASDAFEYISGDISLVIATPEPASLLLLGSMLIGAAMARFPIRKRLSAVG